MAATVLILRGAAVTKKGAVKARANVAKRIVDYKLCVCVKKRGVDEVEGLLVGRVENEEPGLRRIDKSRRAAQLECRCRISGYEEMCASGNHGVD